MPTTFIKDLIDLPEQVSRGDFVLRLTEGVARPEETLRNYVVTPQLATCFDQALGLIKSALEGNTSKAAYLHGSFGSGKSHFMAVLHLLLAGNARARSIPELSEVVARHSPWTEGKKFLLVPYHLIGARNLESAILGHYAAYIRKLHPQAPTPAVYRSDKLLENAEDLRRRLGDEKFFASLSGGRAKSGSEGDGWGEVGAGWDATTYDAARRAPAESRERQRLVGDLIDTLFPAMRETNEFVDLDDGLAILSAHARGLGYDGLVLFLDELILWLASHAANVNFVSQEAQKVPKLVESERADRAVPIVSFVARQRDLRELVGQHITGAESLSFSDVLSWWEARFSMINLEDRNLPAIAEKRVLRPRSAEARQRLDDEFARTAAVREEVIKVLLTSRGNQDDFRKLYPFSPALVETLVAVSSLLQRERTALKIMVQLLVQQRDTLLLGQMVPVGDLYDEIAHGDEAFSTDMKAHFDNAHRLYQQHLRPLLEREHGLTFDAAVELPADDARRRALRNDDRLIKTLLLAALAPQVESLSQMTPGRLAALNHGTIKTPIPGQEAATVLAKCKKWAAAVGQIKIQDSAAGQPTITLQLSGVDTQRILDQAESVDNVGNRIRKLKDILLEQMGVEAEQELYARHPFRWRGTSRQCDLIVNNVRDLPDETLQPKGDEWRIIVDYPFDAPDASVRNDLGRIERFREEGKEGRVICWLPSFLNRKTQQDLGLLVRLDNILTENRFPSFVTHLSEVDRAAARAQLSNQRDQLRGQLISQLEMAYGLRGGGDDYLDPGNRLEPADQFQALLPSLVLQPPVASNFREGLESLLGQALTCQFPAHPKFEDDTQLTKGMLNKVLEVVRAAVRDSNGVSRVDPADRKHMLRIAVPLKLGEMGENRFQVGHHWKQHFSQRLARQAAGTPLTVKRLREWIDDPNPMGLPTWVADLVLLTFAEQTNRFLTLHGGTVEAAIGELHDEAILHETCLPSAPTWEAARERAKHIFGVDASPLLNAGNLAQLAIAIRSVIAEHRAAVRSLPGRLAASQDQYWPDLESSTRLSTATEVDSLVRQLESARNETELITRLAELKLNAKPVVLGKSLKSAPDVETALHSRDDWEIFGSIRHLTDERRPAADDIWRQLEECLTCDELAVALSHTVRTLRSKALNLLTQAPPPPPAPPTPPVSRVGEEPDRTGSQPPSPPPPSPPPTRHNWVGSDEAEVRAVYGSDEVRIARNRRWVSDLKTLYGRSQVEGDSLPAWVSGELAAELLEVHHIKPLSDGGPDERSNMMVLTPTLHAMVHRDPKARIDLERRELRLPTLNLTLRIEVRPDHQG